MALELDIGANTRAAQKNIQNLGEALEDVADSLDDMARDGARDADKLEDELADVARQAGKTEKAVDDIGTGGTRGFGAAKQASADFKQEAVQNFSEVSSSFNGSMASIQDLAQGTLGGLATSAIPGVSVAAGIAALAVGAIGSALGDAETKRQALEEKANDLAQAYIDAGGKVLDALTIADRTADILTDPKRRQEAKELAEVLGGDLPLAVRVLAGDTDALKTAQEQAAVAQAALDALTPQQLANTGKRKTETAAEAEAAKKLVEAVKVQTEIQAMAAETANVQSQIFADLINSTDGVTESVDALGNKLYTLPDGKQIMVDAETGQATANVDKFQGDLDGITPVVTSTVRVDVDDSAWRNWNPVIKHGTVYTRNDGGLNWQ